MKFNEFVGKIRTKYPDAYQELSDTELGFRIITKHPVYLEQIDASSIPNPYKANENLSKGYMHEATEKERLIASLGVDPLGQEFVEAKAFYDQRLGIDHTPTMLEQQVSIEYGRNETLKGANQKNKEAALLQFEKQNKFLQTFDILWENLKVAGKQAPEYIVGNLAKFGLASQYGMTQPMYANSNFIQYQKDITKSLNQIENTESFQLARKAVKQDAELRDAYIEKFRNPTSQSLAKSFSEGNWSQAGKDVFDLALLELPNFLLIVGTSLVNPALGLAYVGTTSGSQRYAEGIANGESVEEASANANAYAVAEIAFEKLGSIGLIESAVKRTAKGEFTRSFAQKAVDLAREPATEMATTITQNLVDDRKWNEGIVESAVIGGLYGGSVNVAITLGDAARTRKQNTDAEIDAIIEQDPVLSETPERARLAEDALKRPDAKNVNNLNQDIFKEEEVEVEVAPEVSNLQQQISTLDNALLDPDISTRDAQNIAITRDALQDRLDKEQADIVVEPVVETPAKTEEGIPLVVGISQRANQDLDSLFSTEELSKPERIKQTKTIQMALDENLNNEADVIIAKAESGKPLSHKEMGGLLIRKTEVVNEIEQLRNDIVEATDEQVINDLTTKLNDKVEFGIRITEAARKGGTEIARALASMNMQLDRKVFDLINVTSAAKAAKNSELTQEERQAFQDDVNAIKSIEKELVDLDNMSPQEILLYEIENAVRVIRNKKSRKPSKDSALKLIKQRQDKIFSLLETLNGRKPQSKKIKKAQIEDTSGYLAMIQNLQKDIQNQKQILKLDAKIHDLEKSLETGELVKRSPKKRIVKSDIVLEKEARIKDLQRQINRRIDSLKPQSRLQVVGSVYDALRNTKLTGDVGHLLRQGGFVISNPRMWFDGSGGRFFRESFKAFSKIDADKTEVAMQSDPDYKKAKQAGLRLIQEGDKLSDREEILMNSLLDKIPVVGTATESFGRVQITGTNLIRFLTFKSYLANNPNATIDDMKDIAYAVNILTGYGEYTSRGGSIERVLNKVLTSPRFTASRFQAPVLLALSRGDRKIWNNKALRNRIIEDTSFFIGTRLALMYLASLALPEIEVGDDPDHWTFGRLMVKVDNNKTRIYDPWAGIQGMMRIFIPLISTDVDFGKFAGKLFDGRKHPALSAYEGIATGKNFVGEDITKGEAVMSAFSPIVFETAKEAYKEDTGVLDLLAAIATDAIGIGSSLIDSDDLRKQLNKK